MPTKNERINYAHLVRTLTRLGVTELHIDALVKIERALSRWHERECNGIEYRDGVPYEYVDARFIGANDARQWRRVADKGGGALKRLAAIMANYPSLDAYVQTDPRGCALYIFEKKAMKGLDVNAHYSSKAIAIRI